MKDRIHEHLSGELRQASRTDTTITIIAVVVTFILFGISAMILIYQYDLLMLQKYLASTSSIVTETNAI